MIHLLVFLADVTPPGDTTVSNALIAFVVIVIGVIGALAVLVPPIVKRQVAIIQTAQENRITANHDAIEEAQAVVRQEREAADEQRKQFARMIEASIKRDEAAVEVQRATVKAFSRQLEMTLRQTELQESNNKELHANTKVGIEGVTAISELSDNIDALNLTSVKATDLLQTTVEQLRKDIAEGLITAADTSKKVTFITTKLVEIDTLKLTLEEMLKVANATLIMAWHNAGSPPELKPASANGEAPIPLATDAPAGDSAPAA